MCAFVTQHFLSTWGVNVLKTPETNPSTSYDEWLGSAYTSEINNRFYYLAATRRNAKLL